MGYAAIDIAPASEAASATHTGAPQQAQTAPSALIAIDSLSEIKFNFVIDLSIRCPSPTKPKLSPTICNADIPICPKNLFIELLLCSFDSFNLEVYRFASHGIVLICRNSLTRRHHGAQSRQDNYTGWRKCVRPSPPEVI